MKRRGNVGHSRDGVKLNPLSFALGFITGGSIAFLILIHHVMPRDKPLHMLDHIDIPTSKNSIALKKEANNNVKKIDGWHPINVFYGEESGLGSPPGRKWFAQVHQDEILIDLIGPNGYFIDLASNDAMEFSNTLALERHGWEGVCIEPNPAYWYGLSHRKCTVIGALVGATKEKVSVKFRGVYGGIVGKMDERLANRKKEPDAILEQRFTAPLIQVLQNFHVPTVVDYLSLDVEGAEYLIMKDFPFSQYLIKIMTVERPSQELRQLLEDHGYVFLKELAWWGETLWAHQSTGFTAEHPKIKSIKTEERN
jgi:Methyltransferase FkbM domain